MSILNVIITYNKLFRGMAYASCSSLKNKNIFVHLNYVDVSTKNNQGYKSSSWYQCLDKKIKFANKKFEEMEYGEILCVSDADVHYFDSDKVFEVKQYMKNKNLSLIGASENYPENTGYINCGLIFVQKNDETQNFFKRIIDLIDENESLPNPKKGATGGNLDEQDIINIISKDLRYELLSPIKFPMMCYIDHVIKTERKTDIALVHATCSYTLKEKEQKIDEIISRLDHEKVKRYRTPLTKKEYALYIDGELQYDTRQ